MQIIDYIALEKNALYFKKKLGNSKLCAVLKNNAYGHGLTHVARHLADIVDYFAVGNVDEAEQVQFLRKDTLILLPQNERNTERAVKLDCILTVDSLQTLALVDRVAQRLRRIARVHVKFDSGMSRLGFSKSEIGQLLSKLQYAHVSVEGIFSHFYGETVAECDKQLMYFNTCCYEFEKSYKKQLTCHIANTSATLLSPKYHLDMARIGLGLYGYGSEFLQPVKSVFADVIAVKEVVAGSVVGYGAKYTCDKATQIAVLNVGYAIGLARTLVGAKIKIGEKYFPIVAICMAMTLVDAGDANVNVGDVATLLSNEVNISNDEVIIYELLCNLQ